MLIILFNWIYIIITTFTLGYFGITLLDRFLNHNTYHKLDTILITGLIIATVYAQFISLFTGVSLYANIAMIVICLIIIFLLRRELYEYISYLISLHNLLNIKQYLPLTLIVIAMLYSTSRGYMHYDTGLYHAQSIRWIEEYGVVPGLGLVHNRLAYNSSSFALSALYSMRFILPQSLHAVAGLLATIVLLISLSIIKHYIVNYIGFRKNKDNIIPTFGLELFPALGAVYYIVIIYTEVLSPASDYYAVLLIFYIVIKWFGLCTIERQATSTQQSDPLPYAYLSLLILYAITIKLTVGLLIAVSIYPAIILIFNTCNSKYRLHNAINRDVPNYNPNLYITSKTNFSLKTTIIIIIVGILIISPYLIRNVIISGWLLYPFTSIDLFNPIWKMSKGLADFDSKEIQVYGRAIYDVLQYELPVRSWFPNWFHLLHSSDKILVITAIISIPISIILMFINRAKINLALLTMWISLIFSYIFWQLSAPLIRYGYVYICLLPLITIGYILISIFHKHNYNIQNGTSSFLTIKLIKLLNNLLLIAICSFLAYKGIYITKIILINLHKPYYIYQQDYTEYPTEEYYIDEIPFYIPIDGDQTGYEAFPSAPIIPNISRYGLDIQDGFIPLE